MRTENRSALIIRPKEPYLNWAFSVGDDTDDIDDLAEDILGHSSIYLVAQDPNDESESAPIPDYFARIFALELNAWHTDQSDWPQKRDYSLFLEWFDVEALSLIVDLEEANLQIEDI